MGVFGTFCQICAMPVQHNCYVPMEGRMLFIYRGRKDASPSDPKPDFPFGPEHDWLIKAVALRLDPSEERDVIRGPVDDGVIWLGDYEEEFEVDDGVGERAALHEKCWELSGKNEWSELSHCRESDAWKALHKYHGQLFEYDELTADGLAWMTVDPTLDTADAVKNRERILKILTNG
ncbi:MAG: hypothetical protein P1V97_16430 [Planctomycetota bacterium]|nr:hypothetical protein [Planctomycetota bacterium]